MNDCYELGYEEGYRDGQEDEGAKEEGTLDGQDAEDIGNIDESQFDEPFTVDSNSNDCSDYQEGYHNGYTDGSIRAYRDAYMSAYREERDEQHEEEEENYPDTFIQEALSYNSPHNFVNQATGEFKSLLEGDDPPLGDEWIEMPGDRIFAEWYLMHDFALEQQPAVKEKLRNAIHYTGAFRRFKEEICSLGLEDKWHAFRDKYHQRQMAAWLRENDVCCPALAQ
jgi:hypothetical protein